jgi:hypothetical protein
MAGIISLPSYLQTVFSVVGSSYLETVFSVVHFESSLVDSIVMTVDLFISGHPVEGFLVIWKKLTHNMTCSTKVYRYIFWFLRGTQKYFTHSSEFLLIMTSLSDL